MANLSQGRKLLLMNDTTNWYHYGCTATSTALKNYLQKLGFDISALPITETYKIKSVPSTYIGFLEENNLKVFAANNSKLFELLKSHDVVVINGEGTMHGVNQAPLSLLFVAYIAKRYLGKIVEILNHSAYPQHDTTIADTEESAIYKLVYDTIDFAAIREPISFATMHKLTQKPIQSFDCMPLYIKDEYQKNEKKSYNELLIAGSASWVQIDMLSKQKSHIENYKHGISCFFRVLDTMTKKGFSIKFLYGAAAFPSKDDQELITYMKNNFNGNVIVHEASSLNDWLKTIEQARLLVSGRFHHTIAAACLGTDYIALNSNTPKIEGIMQILDREASVLQFKDPDIYNMLITKIEEKLSNEIGKKMVDQSETLLKRLCEKAECNFQKL